MAVGDAYGAAEGRDDVPGALHESAWRTERIDRNTCQSVAEFAFVTATSMHGLVYGGPKWTASAICEGMLKEEMDRAAERYRDVPYHPMLIDAAYAGLMTEQWDQPVVIPSLNRDGDCLSDLVLAMFGSIAGAESVLLALDEKLTPTAAMAEAPHGTAPSLEGKNVANSMSMLLACAAVLEHAGLHRDERRAEASRALRQAPLTTAMDGIRRFDLSGSASTPEVVDEVMVRMRNR